MTRSKLKEVVEKGVVSTLIVQEPCAVHYYIFTVGLILDFTLILIMHLFRLRRDSSKTFIFFKSEKILTFFVKLSIKCQKSFVKYIYIFAHISHTFVMDFCD